MSYERGWDLIFDLKNLVCDATALVLWESKRLFPGINKIIPKYQASLSMTPTVKLKTMWCSVYLGDNKL